jgi:netrin-G3 ligand
MVWEHNVTIIVMLTKLKEMGREKCVQYWPIDRSTRYGYFIVDPVGAYNMPQYLLSEFKVTDSRVMKKKIFYSLRQIYYFDIGWTISNCSSFLVYRMAGTRCTESG